MVLNNQEHWIVESFEQFLEMLKEDIGNAIDVTESCLPDDYLEMSEATTGWENFSLEEKIKTVLEQDETNLYHIITIGEVVVITIVNLYISKSFPKNVVAYNLYFGEDGIYDEIQTVESMENDEWISNTTLPVEVNW